MKKIKFNNNLKIELREKQTSSFDRSVAGWIAEDKSYYCVFRDYKTHKLYCTDKENRIKWSEDNVLSPEDEPRVICGNLVRPMTESEEMAYNEDRLLAVVDIFGNISCTEEFDVDWYYENCI